MAKKPYTPSAFPGSVSTVELKLKRLPETDEWKVQWFKDGKLDEAKSYYTNDKQDAFDTLRAMENEAIKAGFKVKTHT